MCLRPARDTVNAEDRNAEDSLSSNPESKLRTPKLRTLTLPMPEQPSADQKTLNLLQTKLLPLAQRIAGIAKVSNGLVRLLLIVASLSALWLMIYLQEVFNLSLLVALIVLLVLALPAIVLGILYISLQEAIALVDEVNQLIATLTREIGEIHGQATNALRSGGRKNLAIGSLFSLGSSLFSLRSLVREVLSLTNDVGGLALKLKGLLIALNPIYLVAVLISVLATIVLAIAAIITGIIIVSV